MKKKSLIVLALCALATCAAGKASAENGLNVQAKAAALIERESGRVLYAQNEEAALPMASTTKVMTALLALEHGGLDEVVTVGRNAFGVPGTSIYLSEGERITLRDLLYGLMLASGNDAAVAIAEHVDGSVEAFCRHMTQRARELGCEKTTFVNPNGLPVSGHCTTALELALIAREAMRHELFRQMVSTQRASIPWEGRGYDRVLSNKNRLLSEYDGATGIKTGYTKAAGRCLVFGAKRDGLELIGVVLNCPDWFEEAKRLLDDGFARYESFTAYGAGETVRVAAVENGKQQTAVLALAQELKAVIPKGELPSLELDVPDTLAAGLAKGEAVGMARLVLEGEVLAQSPVVLAETLAERDYLFEVERMLDRWIPFPVVAD
ncbi:MAG: D-alanyl-D-alanine carboxypeptidase [Eubacteriales bacterium]|nr:D-alanyl-D-alanine carboxypeptidase [Eubacteriales bacterium]